MNNFMRRVFCWRHYPMYFIKSMSWRCSLFAAFAGHGLHYTRKESTK